MLISSVTSLIPIEWVECCRLPFSNVVFNLTTEHYGFPRKILIMTFKLNPISSLKLSKYLFETLFANVPCISCLHLYYTESFKK